MRNLATTVVCLATLSTTWHSAAARDLPDLVITRADLQMTGNCSRGKPLLAGRVTVKNTGVGRAQIFTTRIMLRSNVIGRNDIAGADRFVNSMRPGEEVFVDVRLASSGQGPVAGLAGDYDIELSVDPLNVFRESNERNNTARARVKINCP